MTISKTDSETRRGQSSGQARTALRPDRQPLREAGATPCRHPGWAVRSTSSRAESKACGGREAQGRQRQTQPGHSKGSQTRSRCLPTGNSRTRRCSRSAWLTRAQAAGRDPGCSRLQKHTFGTSSPPALVRQLRFAWLRLPRRPYL